MERLDVEWVTVFRLDSLCAWSDILVQKMGTGNMPKTIKSIFSIIKQEGRLLKMMK